jgi:hypothetical protein
MTQPHPRRPGAPRRSRRSIGEAFFQARGHSHKPVGCRGCELRPAGRRALRMYRGAQQPRNIGQLVLPRTADRSQGHRLARATPRGATLYAVGAAQEGSPPPARPRHEGTRFGNGVPRRIHGELQCRLGHRPSRPILGQAGRGGLDDPGKPSPRYGHLHQCSPAFWSPSRGLIAFPALMGHVLLGRSNGYARK